MFQSRMIVEAHHGSVLVESSPGNGTTFRISLPVT
jgi:signal transduction histidine kinase